MKINIRLVEFEMQEKIQKTARNKKRSYQAEKQNLHAKNRWLEEENSRHMEENRCLIDENGYLWQEKYHTEVINRRLRKDIKRLVNKAKCLIMENNRLRGAVVDLSLNNHTKPYHSSIFSHPSKQSETQQQHSKRAS